MTWCASILRALYRGSVARPRRWWSSCPMRQRHSSRASPVRCTTWKGSMTALASRSYSAAALLKPGESIHRDDLDALTPRVGAGGQPGFEDLLGATRDHVQEPGGAAAFSDRRQVQDNGDVFVAVGGVAPHVFIHPDDTHPLETCWIIDQ